MSTAQRHIAGARARRRWRILLIGGAALAATLTTGLSVEGFDASGIASAAVQRAKSFLELMQQRSPGRRTTATLTKTKHKTARLHQRALPKIRFAIPALAPEYPKSLVEIVAPPVQTAAALDAIPIPLLAQTIPPPGVPFNPPPSVIVPPVIPTETPSPPVIQPPSAVPEPATWMTMLLGFGLVGWRLRRRRPKPSSLRLS